MSVLLRLSTALCLLTTVLFALASCGGDETPDDAGISALTDDPASPTNRIAIPAAVRRNLGISFIQVEVRQIEQTIRVPGRFEYLPTARQEYRTMLPGRVTLIVEQFSRVERGDVLYRLDSPAWRDLQHRIGDADASVQRLEARQATFEPLLEAHAIHEQGLRASVALWQERVQQLEEMRQAGGGRLAELANARAALVTAQSDLGEVHEKDAQLAAERAEVDAALGAARFQRSLLLETAAMLLGENVSMLLETLDDGRARWRTITRVAVKAESGGVVESLNLTNGAWADEKTNVMTVVQPDRLRFRASGLQSDLGALRDGLMTRIVSPTPTTTGRAPSLQDTMSGLLTLGLAGDPDQRTIDLFVVPETLAAWARPGVSAQLEVVTDATSRPSLAVPLAAIQRDGLTPVIFRRAPDNPNEAIRMEADLGMSDGRWVAVQSGLSRDDEVILDGAFQLMLATSGSMSGGGHFHADGTFHEEDH